MSNKEIVILYHENCIDGFASAWVAHKKFGERADYIAVKDKNLPDGLEQKEIYIIDFNYPKNILRGIEKVAKKLVVLDHHISAKKDVTSIKEYVFSIEQSGAGIAWRYFFPDKSVPNLIQYVEDNDIWHFSIPNSKEIQQIIATIPFEFNAYEKLYKKLENKEEFKKILEEGTIRKKQYDDIIENLTIFARKVNFDGYEVYATNASRPFRSELGHLLAKRKPPFSIVWYHDGDSLHFSLRGDGSIDISKIAKKYGGGGHHNAASFSINKQLPLPFTFI